MRFPRGVFFAMQLGAALFGLLVPQLGFAYDHPLTDEAVRAGYFLGQDLDRSNHFFAQYTQALPMPNSGPQVAEIELLTPYAQVVQVSHEHPMGYSAQQAAAAERKNTEEPASTAAWQMFWAIMVLPSPLAPTRMMLRASLRKSSVKARSMTSRSMRVGQDQSKSAIGLNLLMPESRRRVSRLRRDRSASSACATCSKIW